MYNNLISNAINASNEARNRANKDKTFDYAIMDKDFRVVETGVCTNVYFRYDSCYDYNVVSFTDVNTTKTYCICEFYVKLSERGGM